MKSFNVGENTLNSKEINHAYCSPGGEFGTIEAQCDNAKESVDYWSNPDIKINGIPAGTDLNNNAKAMSEKRFESASAGTNCLDGDPGKAMSERNNCPKNEEQYEPPLSDSTGKMEHFNLKYFSNVCVYNSYALLPLFIPFYFNFVVVNCEYSDWGPWSKCDETCGGGHQTQTRKVVRHAWYGGIKCTEEGLVNKRACNEHACPG